MSQPPPASHPTPRALMRTATANRHVLTQPLSSLSFPPQHLQSEADMALTDLVATADKAES